MLRFVAGRVNTYFRSALLPKSTVINVQTTRKSSHIVETDEEFDARYEAFFNRNDIDHWEIRKAMSDLAGK